MCACVHVHCCGLPLRQTARYRALPCTLSFAVTSLVQCVSVLTNHHAINVCVCADLQVQPGGCLLEAARQASAEVIAAGGSFKCLQLQQAGHTAEAAAAAAAEAAARQELKQQQQQKVVCHALEDVSSEDDDDTLVMMDSCDSNISNLSSSSSMAVEEFGKIGGKGRGRCSSSSGSSEGRVSAAGSVSSISSGGSSFGQLVMAMSTSFSDMMRPAAAN